MMTKDLRKFFSPIQPWVNEKNEHIIYNEILPDINLQPFIYCYWQLKANPYLPAVYNYKVVADGCIDIFFDLKDPDDSYIMGFADHYTEFYLNGSINYIGIRFLPSAFPLLFKTDASELTNQCARLKDLSRFVSDYISRAFSKGLSKSDIKTILDKLFRTIISGTDIKTDLRFTDALLTIFNSTEKIFLETDLNTGLSPRQLRRLFRFYAGASPKTFVKVIRFQKTLKEACFGLTQNYSDLAFLNGYYDQPHFIRDFKSLYGLTPGKVFNK